MCRVRKNLGECIRFLAILIWTDYRVWGSIFLKEMLVVKFFFSIRNEKGVEEFDNVWYENRSFGANKF